MILKRETCVVNNNCASDISMMIDRRYLSRIIVRWLAYDRLHYDPSSLFDL